MKPLRFILFATLAALVTACGGGTGGTGVTNGGGGGGTNAVSIGVMSKGSVIVNGVHFEDTGANISIDDTPKTDADLRDGMVVKVLGSINDDGITGTAQQVKALIEVRGTPTSVNPTANPQSLVVLGQTVLVDDQTVYSNLLGGFNAITTSTLIEVHGLRDATGQIRATRIEANTAQMGDATVDEIRGVVSLGAGTNPTTFNLGSQVVSVVGGAVITPSGATYQNGSVVEVFCSARPCISGSVFQASRVKVENAQDAVFQPGPGQQLEVEGLISDFNGHPGSFFVAGIPVTTTTATLFEGGIADDLGDDIQVEAEGTWNGTSLAATKIEFKRSVVRLQGETAHRNTTDNSFDLRIANGSYVVRIELNSLTLGPLPADGLACVRVRGQRKIGASTLTVTAGDIELLCSNSGRHVIQAPVEAESPENTITLLGFALDVSAPTDQPPYKGANGQPLTRTGFFNAVTPATTSTAGSVAGTLVRVLFNEGAITVRQVEIED